MQFFSHVNFLKYVLTMRFYKIFNESCSSYLLVTLFAAWLNWTVLCFDCRSAIMNVNHSQITQNRVKSFGIVSFFAISLRLTIEIKSKSQISFVKELCSINLCYKRANRSESDIFEYSIFMIMLNCCWFWPNPKNQSSIHSKYVTFFFFRARLAVMVSETY